MISSSTIKIKALIKTHYPMPIKKTDQRLSNRLLIPKWTTHHQRPIPLT
jgi:hypothetical protein